MYSAVHHKVNVLLNVHHKVNVLLSSASEHGQNASLRVNLHHPLPACSVIVWRIQAVSCWMWSMCTAVVHAPELGMFSSIHLQPGTGHSACSPRVYGIRFGIYFSATTAATCGACVHACMMLLASSGHFRWSFTKLRTQAN